MDVSFLSHLDEKLSAINLIQVYFTDVFTFVLLYDLFQETGVQILITSPRVGSKKGWNLVV